MAVRLPTKQKRVNFPAVLGVSSEQIHLWVWGLVFFYGLVKLPLELFALGEVGLVVELEPRLLGGSHFLRQVDDFVCCHCIGLFELSHYLYYIPSLIKTTFGEGDGILLSLPWVMVLFLEGVEPYWVVVILKRKTSAGK